MCGSLLERGPQSVRQEPFGHRPSVPRHGRKVRRYFVEQARAAPSMAPPGGRVHPICCFPGILQQQRQRNIFYSDAPAPKIGIPPTLAVVYLTPLLRVRRGLIGSVYPCGSRLSVIRPLTTIRLKGRAPITRSDRDGAAGIRVVYLRAKQEVKKARKLHNATQRVRSRRFVFPTLEVPECPTSTRIQGLRPPATTIRRGL